MADSCELCFFHELYSCKKKTEKLQNASKVRIQTIINCSAQWNESYNYQAQLEKLLTETENPTIRVHKSCVSRYTSSTNINAHVAHVRKLESDSEDDEQSAPKRLRSGSGDQFNFRKHCLFCPNVSPCFLASEYDNKVPINRRKPAYLIRSTERTDGKEYKQYILDICDKRNDNLGEIVKTRVQSAVADLHAADARCHTQCRATFMSARNVKYSSEGRCTTKDDPAFKSVCDKLLEHRQKTWSSVELFALYVDEGGCCVSRKTLFKKIVEYLGDDVVVLSSPGFANILGFKSQLAKSLHLVKNNDDDIDYCIERVGSVITKECLTLKKRKDVHQIDIDKDLARESVGDTTALLLSKISSTLENDSLTMILLGNIITGTVCCQSTDLQVALGILMRRNKTLISELSKYSVCCSYDEVRLFRYSAAVHVAQNHDETEMIGGNNLVHCVCDNFDAEISSPNCKTCVHCLAMIMAQVQLPQEGREVLPDEGTAKRKTIKRQPMQDRSKPVVYDVEQEVYHGPKNPLMPKEQAVRQVPSLSLLASQVLSTKTAQENDLAFLQHINTETDCPEYNGYNTRHWRTMGIPPKQKKHVTYMPLVDRPPAHHNTIKTAMEKGLSLAKSRKEDVLIFTADQQLYKIVIDVMFHQPSYFDSIIPVLGGMHLLMNFIHAVAIIMNGSGLKEILASTFGSVDSMLSGKKYPQNFRALRLLVEELLHDVVQEQGLISFSGLTSLLSAQADRSRTAKMWINNLVKGVFIMMLFSRAAHEGDWTLHLTAAEAMLPFFRSAGCHNYARYAAFYVHHMKGLSPKMIDKLQHGAFVQHIPGIYNATWTDMFIETTYMRMGHGPAGAVGIATDYHQMVKWALSFALCGEVTQNVKNMGTTEDNHIHTHHKEEAPSRIKADQADRNSLRNNLDVIINPLDVESHPDGALLNIVTGQIAHPDVNADEATTIGEQAMKDFIYGWPDTFYDSLGKLVTTMDLQRKHVRVGTEKVYDQELIYARVIGLLASSRELNFEEVLAYELAAYPPSMFSPDGEMKIAKSKSVMKQKLQVTLSERNCFSPDTIIYDVSALLWVIPWPSGKLKVFIESFKSLLFKDLQTSSVILVFDRYFPNSVKSFTRMQRAKSSRVHKLSAEMNAPAKQVVLTNTKNKVQLNSLLQKGISETEFSCEATRKHSLTIVGASNVPVEILRGVRNERVDLLSSHEEADNLIAKHAISSSLSGKTVRVVSDDTDVFVLLVHFYHTMCEVNNSVPMIMSSPVKERAVIDIRATANKHSDIADDLLAIHGLSGADTVAAFHGIGKTSVIHVSKKGKYSLSEVGAANADMKSVETQATQFMCAAYGKVAESCASMTECRVKLWRAKTGKSGASSVKLCSLPPTTDAFLENVHRCHIQVAIWKAALQESPPDMDPTRYGWEHDHQGFLLPRTVPPGTLSAPSYVLELIRCNCKSSGCRTAACSCSKLGCTMFCLCEGGEACRNPLTKNQFDVCEEDFTTEDLEKECDETSD